MSQAAVTMKQMAAEFLISEAEGTLSRDQVLIDKGLTLEAGTVMAALSGASTATSGVPWSGNTGNGVITSGVAVSGAYAGQKEGNYTLTMTASAVSGGSFKLTDPFGMLVGTGVVGTEFSKSGLTFTMNYGSANFAVGDYFTIAVNIIKGNYVAYDPTLSDGSQTTLGVLYDSVDSTDNDVLATIINAFAEVDASKLKWGSGVTTAAHKATAYAALLALGIKTR